MDPQLLQYALEYEMTQRETDEYERDYDPEEELE